MRDGCTQRPVAPPSRTPPTAGDPADPSTRSYLMLLRTFFKAAAGAREKQKTALYAACADQVAPALAALLAILDGPNCKEVGAHAGGCIAWRVREVHRMGACMGQPLRVLFCAALPADYNAPARQTYKPLLIELALTLPAPLSDQLMLLPKLMRPLVLSLKCAARPRMPPAGSGPACHTAANPAWRMHAGRSEAQLFHRQTSQHQTTADCSQHPPTPTGAALSWRSWG